ncbi:N-acetyltransferase [Chitinophaga alhagiae]|uniref:N-acetyltransferase n=1 Tax=Chitinophaga alhagiae TaxID=2203219 RepID=A0ABM6W9X8_9BACT|nr:N-acetyltransferase [Chitinophaga alhagiae]AWO00705.1 N-acetyltransferase [Chitinophaga alhagiae]
MESGPKTAEGVVPEVMGDIIIRVAHAGDIIYADTISAEMESSALARGTGISKRPPSLIREKILQGKAVIALCKNGIWAGFSYLQTWERETFVSNSGLIVAPAFREKGIAALIKVKIFQLSRLLYPAARLFSITTSAAVMKLNARLGFLPVTFAALPADPLFWEGCRSCVNHHILCSKQHRNCLCTALLFSPPG